MSMSSAAITKKQAKIINEQDVFNVKLATFSKHISTATANMIILEPAQKDNTYKKKKRE